MKNIAIFASGTGSNAKKILEHFQGRQDVGVALVASNRPDAGVLATAKQHGVPTLVLQRKLFYEQPGVLETLQAYDVDFIALAGFLWLIPAHLVRAYEGRMLNIHPSLLPDFGGKGMFGMHVHEAVKNAGVQQSGMTIHWVNEHYDTGDVVRQATCPVWPEDSPSDIAARVLALEHQHYAPLLDELLMEIPKLYA